MIIDCNIFLKIFEIWNIVRQKEKNKYRVDFPNLWGAQQPLGLMGCHMVRMEGERGSVTMRLNPRASFEKHWRLGFIQTAEENSV